MEYRQLLSIMLDEMTQEELAIQLRTTQATISRWLKGQEPRGGALERIRALARQKRLAQDATISNSDIEIGYDIDDPESTVFRASTLRQRRSRISKERPKDALISDGYTSALEPPASEDQLSSEAITLADQPLMNTDIQRDQKRSSPSGDIVNFTIKAGMGNGGAISVQLGTDGQIIDPADCDGFWSFPDKVKAGWRHMPQTYAMQVTGDSMEPSLSNGSYVFIDTSHTYPAPPDLFAVDYGHGLMIKRVELLPNEQIRIMSDNERYSDFDFHVADVTVYGRVVASFAFR